MNKRKNVLPLITILMVGSAISLAWYWIATWPEMFGPWFRILLTGC